MNEPTRRTATEEAMHLLGIAQEKQAELLSLLEITARLLARTDGTDAERKSLALRINRALPEDRRVKVR